MVYPALLPLIRTPRLPVVECTAAPADLNGLVRFAEKWNLVSARVPLHFNRPLPLFISGCQLHCTRPQGDTCESWNYCGKRCISYRSIFYVSQSRMFYSWTCNFNRLYLETFTIFRQLRFIEDNRMKSTAHWNLQIYYSNKHRFSFYVILWKQSEDWNL